MTCCGACRTSRACALTAPPQPTAGDATALSPIPVPFPVRAWRTRLTEPTPTATSAISSRKAETLGIAHNTGAGLADQFLQRFSAEHGYRRAGDYEITVTLRRANRSVAMASARLRAPIFVMADER